MKEDKMKKILFPITVTVTLLLSTFAPAFAEAPFIWTAHFEDKNAYVGSCDGFRILDSYVTDWTIFDYYDSEGNLDRQVGHVKASGMLYNSKNPENYIIYNTNTYKHIYEGGYKKGESDTIVGAYYKLTVPGYGDIFMEVGRIILSRRGDVLFSAGQNDFFAGDLQELCAYFAGQ
jgi:hypothetical protein